MWTLCVPINLRTQEHNWFQSKVVQPFGGAERIKLMQASDILHELINNRPLRDLFFPDNAMSDLLKVRQIAMGTEGSTIEQRGALTAEYAQQYLESKMELDPRLEQIVTYGGNPLTRQAGQIPGLVMSVDEGNQTTHFVARDPKAYNLDPIRFTTSIKHKERQDMDWAMDAGLPFKMPAGGLLGISSTSPLLRAFFDGKSPADFGMELRPRIPPELALKDVPLRLIAGRGPTAKEIAYIPFRMKHCGRREITFVNVGRLPLEADLKLRLAIEEGATFAFSPKLQGSDSQDLNHILEFLDELERSGQFEVLSIEPPLTLLRQDGNFTQNLGIPPGLRQAISDAAFVSEFFGKKLRIPEEIREGDLENLLMLKRVATGDPFFDVVLNSNLIKSAAHGDQISAMVDGAAQFFRFESSGMQTVKVFGQEIETGPTAFEASNVTLVSPSMTREAYLAAPEGAAVPWKLNCAGPCRFILSSSNPGTEPIT